jgi:hypothetical protein
MSTKEQLGTMEPHSATFNFFDSEQFDTMQRVCKLFANSELVPEMYRISGKNNTEVKAIANCMIAISLAVRIGADPLMIMQNLIIIYGRPSWSAKFLIGSVNTCGRFNPLQFRFTEKGMLGKIDYTEYTKVWNGNRYDTSSKTVTFDGTKVMDIECIAYTTAKGSNETLESSPISIRMAIEERWYTKDGSKWKTMPKQMLMYRAASFWTNVYAPEISMGLKTEDEVRDIVDVEHEDLTDVAEKVSEEIDNRANTGTKLSFNAENPANTTTPTGQSTPTDATPTGTPTPVGNSQQKMPGF